MSTANNSNNSTTTPSDARVEANRRNAQLSTGPRTEAGKARSAMNALRSGWFSRDLHVAPGKEQLYLEFEQVWRDELAPEGLVEEETFTDFLRASWRKREIIEAQNELTASTSANNIFLDENIERRLDRLHRYERDFERRAARALRELRRLQATERPTATATATTSSRRVQPPLDIPDDLRLQLHVMDVETANWNARLRARKAGFTVEPRPAAS